MLSTKKAIKKKERKHALDQEIKKKKKNAVSTKKIRKKPITAMKKETKTLPRTIKKKLFLGRFHGGEGVFFLFLAFCYLLKILTSACSIRIYLLVLCTFGFEVKTCPTISNDKVIFSAEKK